eukprot:SAG31_NODE_1462_length_8242_cov_5.541135_1_plen_110_part_00
MAAAISGVRIVDGGAGVGSGAAICGAGAGVGAAIIAAAVPFEAAILSYKILDGGMAGRRAAALLGVHGRTAVLVPLCNSCTNVCTRRRVSGYRYSDGKAAAAATSRSSL